MFFLHGANGAPLFLLILFHQAVNAFESQISQDGVLSKCRLLQSAFQQKISKTGRYTNVVGRFFNNSSQGSRPSHLQSQESSLPSEDPLSPRFGASEPLALSLSPSVFPKCMGALPLGVPSPFALRGRYPLMPHSHEKVHWIYVDGVGCFSRDPPCKGEAQVDDNGHLMPCAPCEALPRDPTMCKFMHEERTADSSTKHWKLGFLKLSERAARHRAEKRAVVKELRRVSDVCQTLVQK